ncbi:MAG: ATP-dependent zinc metalloprotease FtsH [Oscillospiraceae bacterium]|nr:ATP-dependent zinc metalloprotease FtsH [Oscillospiraceae bacterium]
MNSKTPQTSRRGPVLIYVVLLLLMLFAMYKLFNAANNVDIKYSDVITLFKEEKVEAFEIQSNTLKMQLREEFRGQKIVKYQLYDFSLFYQDLGDTVAEQLKAGTLKEYDVLPESQGAWLLTSLLPILLMGGITIVIMIVMMNRMGGGAGNAMKFSKANAKIGKSNKKVTFADVAGAEEEKAELQEIVEFLRDPAKYTRLGAKVPKGVLLVGPPGTGKTLLAKAVAGEADVQFLSISGSDFVELYVGVGAGRVRDLFDQAKKMAPAIIFIDEIDAVGRHRGAGLGGGHDEREQTLNQLLVEMDGFTGNTGVIVMAATNRKDILDPALLRPGRFDRQIYINKPDCKGREEILKVHARGKPLADTVDLHIVARATVGFTGADLENLLNEGALLAARANRPCILMEDLEEAMLKVSYGPQKKSHKVSEKTRRLTAYHEAGHAVAAWYLPHHSPVQMVTVIPRGPTGGMTVFLPEEDQDGMNRSEMTERIVSALGGRIAESLKMDDISTGAAADIQAATSIAHEMVTRYGMSDALGTVRYGDDEEIFVGMSYGRTRPYSDQTAGKIDDEVRRIIDRAYELCEQILRDHDDRLEAVAQYLIEHDTMTRSQFNACMKGEPIPEAEAESIFDRFAELEKQEKEKTDASAEAETPAENENNV